MTARGTAAFKAYDIRGRVPSELDSDLARRIGRAYADLFEPRTVAVGRDVRLSSPELASALVEGLVEGGADVRDLGLCGTEEVYFAVLDGSLDGGIMLTASHNPPDYNGMKIVGPGARPISGDTGLFDLRDRALEDPRPARRSPGHVVPTANADRFVEFMLGQVDVASLPPLRVVCDAGNGCVGPILERMRGALPIEMIVLDGTPDGTFPRGVPNPLLPENRHVTEEAIRRHGADLGVAWDGDFDRCFFYDEGGRFIEGYYLVGLLAERFLRHVPGARVLHDPRLTWNTREIVEAAGGMPVLCKTGHAFIKERMRREDAIYGGEMSAHHYFRDFGYCDSGILPWLLVMETMGTTGRTLADLVGERMERYPVSGEINRAVADPAAAVARVVARFEPEGPTVDRTDGVSLEFARWRFNLRSSNTEPLLRLNVEARGDAALMREKTAEILDLIGGS